MSNELLTKIVQYWDRQPCNINHSASEVGTEQFFNENSEKRYFVEPHLKDLAQFHLYAGKRVLEIGCGDAFATRIVQQTVEKVTAIDFDPIFIENYLKSLNDYLIQ